MYDYLPEAKRKIIEGELGMGGDLAKIVYFEDQVTLDQAASDEAQRPIFKSGTYMHVKMLESLTGKEMSYPVREHHKEQYPKEWAAYLATKDKERGTPTDVLLSFGVKPETVATLKSQGALTLEQVLKMDGQEDAKRIAEMLLRAKDGEDRQRASGDKSRAEHKTETPGSSRDVHPQRESVRIGAEGTEFASTTYQAWG